MVHTHFLIYQIQHKDSGKIYIGKHQTQNPNDNYFGSGKYLILAVEKYGKDAFTKTILFDFDNENEMNAKERELVTEAFCRRKDTYNICEGGRGGFGYINKHGISKFTGKHSEETKQKISQAMTGKKRGPLPDEVRRKISEAKRGICTSPSARRPKTDKEKELIRQKILIWWKERKQAMRR